MHESRRYIGIELSGAKNNKTAVAVLEHYPRKKKTFLLDLYDRITHKEDPLTSDQALLELLDELQQDKACARLGVNVPLELPPCITCTRKACPLPLHCTVPAVKWMRQISRKAKAGEFTPYTQRPIELWIRHEILPELPEWSHFDIDETLGGNRAPLTARMHFLKRHLSAIPMIEALPKLSTAILSDQLRMDKRTASSYRHLELGSHSREEMIEKLTEAHGVFIYERDVRKLSANLTAFDAFICAYTALLADIGKTAKIAKGFPLSSGWIHYPRLDSCSPI